MTPTQATYFKHKLTFINPVRTSRGELTHHTAYFIKLTRGQFSGYGEASPLKGLSIDDRPDFESTLKSCCTLINLGHSTAVLELLAFPSLQFAFETAEKSLKNEKPFLPFHSPFTEGINIPINGLVWMDNTTEMLKMAFRKIEQGFNCIKFKIGAHDFDEECRMLESLRKAKSAFATEIRLDANGAFAPDEALEKLRAISKFDIHSIEQPVQPGYPDEMQEICAKSGIAIALDEELIGRDVNTEGLPMLKHIRPAYIILKPTLLGGFRASDAWIEHAHSLQIGWWATSALESNIGLNSIAQWVSGKSNNLYQGLGTGSIYQNNITSPLVVKNGSLLYDATIAWEVPETKQV